ncbi:hypothetical protein CFF01_04595 [Shewanella marisflavi]|uniref:Uncharacterized protein n=1 Tax=Shewanella marisflavi TaxID=260364 RepID=A0AAC9TYP4_9GAMM|nr:hypothetical protein CFF01_04595 [Shewanella marisflavi]
MFTKLTIFGKKFFYSKVHLCQLQMLRARVTPTFMFTELTIFGKKFFYSKVHLCQLQMLRARVTPTFMFTELTIFGKKFFYSKVHLCQLQMLRTRVTPKFMFTELTIFGKKFFYSKFTSVSCSYGCTVEAKAFATFWITTQSLMTVGGKMNITATLWAKVGIPCAIIFTLPITALKAKGV